LTYFARIVSVKSIPLKNLNNSSYILFLPPLELLRPKSTTAVFVDGTRFVMVNDSLYNTQWGTAIESNTAMLHVDDSRAHWATQSFLELRLYCPSADCTGK
jgi:hypothetical protein